MDILNWFQGLQDEYKLAVFMVLCLIVTYIIMGIQESRGDARHYQEKLNQLPEDKRLMQLAKDKYQLRVFIMCCLTIPLAFGFLGFTVRFFLLLGAIIVGGLIGYFIAIRIAQMDIEESKNE